MQLSWKTHLVTLISLYCTLHSASGVYLQCFKGSLASYTIIQLKDDADPDTLLKSSCYSSDKDTVFYTHGFLQKITDNSGLLVLQAYLDDGTKNVIGLDWSDKNSYPIVGAAALPQAALNSIEVGKKLGEYIIKLVNAGLPLASLHLIGFSLGAHLVGAAGRKVQEGLSQSIPRITGLEPGGTVLFTGSVSLPKLTKSDGVFVEAYHTNPGKIGSDEALSTVDVWVNCKSSVQPGCENAEITNVGAFAPKDICSHLLGPAVFAMTVKNSSDFVATSAADCESWLNEGGTGETIYLGDGIDMTATGSYYISIDTTTEEYQTSAAVKENNDLQQRELDLKSILSIII